MTDKVQKIREWVKARFNENTSKQSLPQFYGMMEEDARFLDFIDSLQEEPATSLWHDASETPVASKDKVVLYTNGKWDLFKAYESLDDYDNYWSSVNQSLAEKGIFVKQWAYTADLIKL